MADESGYGAPDAELESDYYGDSSAYGAGGDEYGEEAQRVPEPTYAPAEDKRATQKPWFKGPISRQEADGLLKPVEGGGMPGNFLVRQKDGQQFVHSYWSVTQKATVHNLIKFSAGAAVTVDGKDFEGKTLDEVIQKLQDRLRQWRATDQDETPAELIAEVQDAWTKIFQPGLNMQQVAEYLSDEPEGGFVISSEGRDHVLNVNTPEGITHHAIGVHPDHGSFLKNSEFLAASLVQMVELLIQSTNRVYAFGIPVQLKCPTGEPLPAATEGVDDTEVAYDRDESYVKATEGGEAYGGPALTNDEGEDPYD